MNRLFIHPDSTPAALRRRRIESYLAHRYCRAQGETEQAEGWRQCARQIGRAMKGKLS